MSSGNFRNIAESTHYDVDGRKDRRSQKMKTKRFRIGIMVLTLALLCSGCVSQDASNQNSEGKIQVSESTENSEATDTESESRDKEEVSSSEISSQEDETDTQQEDNTQDASSEDSEQVEPADSDMVLIMDYIPDMIIDLKYATTDNFTGQVIYDNDDAYLRYGTVKKLMQVQSELKAQGYKLVLWDGYRPVEAQFKLWDICPDPNYVSNPNNGFSKHSRGNTVDITIVTLDGTTVEMPTGFDNFTKEADRDYSDVSATAAANSQMLEDIMAKAGFKGYRGEWWHYTDTTEYPVIE